MNIKQEVKKLAYGQVRLTVRKLDENGHPVVIHTCYRCEFGEWGQAYSPDGYAMPDGRHDGGNPIWREVRREDVPEVVRQLLEEEVS